MSVRSYFESFFGRKQQDVVEATIGGADLTPYYRKRFYDISDFIINELPLFTLWTARAMLFDDAVKIGLAIRSAILSAAQVKVVSSNEQVKEYVQKLHEKMWGSYCNVICRTRQWGFQGVQVFYSQTDGKWYPCHIRTYMPYDVRCRTFRGTPVSFRVTYYGHPTKNGSVLLPPRGLWLTYDTEFHDAYGNSILRYCYPSWFEKWMKHGYKRTAQLRMMKDASRGDRVSYPPRGRYPQNTGQVLSASDIVREMVENTMSGATIRIPSTRDELGNPEWEYAPPVDTGNPVGIMEWGNRLDVGIWRGMGVSEEVVRASDGGSGFSGRSVPFLMTLSECNAEHMEYVQCLKSQIYEPLVWHHFGLDADFDVLCIPLAQTFVEDIAGSSIGGASLGGAHGDRRYPEATDERTGMEGTKLIAPGPIDKGTDANSGSGIGADTKKSPHSPKPPKSKE